MAYRVSSVASTKTLLMKFTHLFIVTDDVYVQVSFGENYNDKTIQKGG